jgi:simple sugar transport system permease protein
VSVDTATPPAAPDVDQTRVLTRSWKAPIVLALFGVVALVVFGIAAPSGEHSTFRVSTSSDFVQIEPFALPSRLVGILLGVLLLLSAAYAFWLVRQARKVPLWLSVMFGLAFVFAFLTWAVAGATISLTSLLQGAVALSVPLIFGALSGLLCERAGVINIAIEGQLLFGAFLSGVVASLTSSTWVGLIAAPIAGLLVAYVLAVFTVKYFVNQIIVGVVLNVLVIGLTNFLFGRLLSPDPATWNSPGRFLRMKIPVLGDIPIIGPVLFDQNVIVYFLYVIVIVVHIALFRSRWGLRVRAVGEHPEAADTAGINVNRTRFRNVLIGGAVAGFGGAYFTLGVSGLFSREMTAGQGFIALAAMILGRWSPIGAVFAGLLFGFANNLQSVLGIIGTPIPSEFMLMAPYLVTIFAVAGFVGRVRPPAADGEPYIKS